MVFPGYSQSLHTALYLDFNAANTDVSRGSGDGEYKLADTSLVRFVGDADAHVAFVTVQNQEDGIFLRALCVFQNVFQRKWKQLHGHLSRSTG